ncbi:MAG: anti-sigma factor family protein, partial [Candidatus Binatia bacterium]
MSSVVADLSTTCHDFQRRFDGFLDGEIEPQAIRQLALHASHCASCARAIEDWETIRQALASEIEREVEGIDGAKLWSAIEGRLEAPRRRWLPAWQIPSAGDWTAFVRVPALAVGGALLAL